MQWVFSFALTRKSSCFKLISLPSQGRNNINPKSIQIHPKNLMFRENRIDVQNNSVFKMAPHPRPKGFYAIKIRWNDAPRQEIFLRPPRVSWIRNIYKIKNQTQPKSGQRKCAIVKVWLPTPLVSANEIGRTYTVGPTECFWWINLVRRPSPLKGPYFHQGPAGWRGMQKE